MKIKKGLSAYTLQFIAVVAMLLDHLAHIVVNMSFAYSLVAAIIMNIIGRITMPIMCFFIAEGFYKTSNLTKYMLRLVGFAIVAQIPYYLFAINGLPQGFWEFVKGNIHHMNVGVTLFMGLVALSVAKSDKYNVVIKIATVAAATYLTRFSDWRYYGVLWILVFGLFHDSFAKQAIFFAIVALTRAWGYSGSLYNITMNCAVLLALPLLYFYSGEKGKKPRYGFYIFYPAHLLVLGIIKLLITT